MFALHVGIIKNWPVIARVNFQSCSGFLVYSIKSVFGNKKSTAALKIDSGNLRLVFNYAHMKCEHLEVKNFRLHPCAFLCRNRTPTIVYFTSLCSQIVEILLYFIIHIAHCIDEKEMNSAMKILANTAL